MHCSLKACKKHIGSRLSYSLPNAAICTRHYATTATSTASSGLPSSSSSSNGTSFPPPWRPSAVLDEWVQREARPTSLRQLTFFGRELTEQRLIQSANYCRIELPTRIAHRLRNMQTLPYAALTNKHISQVYELYYRAFEFFRKAPEVRDLEDNERYCDVLRQTLREHLAVIPQLAMGILEIQDFVTADECDRFMTTLLRSRISRRVIAEQHLALTETFHSSKSDKGTVSSEDEFVGEIFLKCNAREIVDKCSRTVTRLATEAYGPDVQLPQFVLQGHLDTTFPYIPSHIEYIVGELFRNSVQSVVERGRHHSNEEPPPIEVLICEATQHVIIRVSDQGGGVDRDTLPHLWSFAKGPRRDTRLENLGQVPRLAGTMQELQLPSSSTPVTADPSSAGKKIGPYGSSLSPLAARSPNLKLGIGLPMSKIYADYWAGSLALHSLEGYGCDAFLQISRLGNKNEKLSTRASMDAI